MLRSNAFLGSVLFLLLAACAHTEEGARVRTGNVRFDANSVSSPRVSVRKASDGAWRSSSGWALVQEGDTLSYEGTPYSVQITRRPDGLVYEPSWVRGASWTFVTEDGQPIAPELEAPLYIATRAGLGGQWLALWTMTPRGLELDTHCQLVVFTLQGRRVAGWLPRPYETCPSTEFPRAEALATLAHAEGEVYESPERPGP